MALAFVVLSAAALAVAPVRAQEPVGAVPADTCVFIPSISCLATPCPDTAALEFFNCFQSAAPCPAGCLEKEVQALGQSLCAVESAPEGQLSIATAGAAFQCFQNGDTGPQCQQSIAALLTELGCEADCQAEMATTFARSEPCQAAKADEATCTAATPLPCGSVEPVAATPAAVVPIAAAAAPPLGVPEAAEDPSGVPTDSAGVPPDAAGGGAESPLGSTEAGGGAVAVSASAAFAAVVGAAAVALM